jgi:uncharacterized repeat protein (TIGR03803 family)
MGRLTWAALRARGVVYKVERSGQEAVLYSFASGVDGGNPYAGVILDKAGNLYGTTYNGGGSFYAGVVYKLSPSGQETVLHTFAHRIPAADQTLG